MNKKILAFLKKSRKKQLTELCQILKIPSISSSSLHWKSIKDCAEAVQKSFIQIGLKKSIIFKTSGHPIVYAESMQDPQRPTLLFYGHYDVQPVDPLSLWKNDPFEPTVRKGEIYARGAVDDKGQFFIHLKSVEAYLSTHSSLPVNVKFLIEGEEEIGSPHLENFIQRNQGLLSCNTVVISDTAMFKKGLPTLCYGLRGLIYFQIDIEGPRSDLHSGIFGGAVPNPAETLVRLLASLKNSKGRITIPDFYRNVKTLTPIEKKEFRRLPFQNKQFERETGIHKTVGEQGYSTLERLWARPTLEINGLSSGFTGEGSKTVLPAKAMAKVSMRLVPDQDYQKIGKLFEKHLKKLCPDTVKIKIMNLHGGNPWITDLNHHALAAAAQALEQGFGKKPVFVREGGSIPVVAIFERIMNLPVVLMGFGAPDEQAHAPNEKLNLQHFYNGILSSAYFLEKMILSQTETSRY